MTQRSIHSQNAPHRPHGQAQALRAASIDASLLIKLAPLAAALVLVLVLITGHASAEYGFA
ncbi:hypothetical protein J2X06_000718 [Lysobacter niastensis]|jgi:hypothetical protein|uniref:ABC transporter permease n=1 Tax=Lysobacter niastensis TaxID=380629 RepID=A0ABU1W7H8_9GAMM|nr:hypothetical protein [Lysobacter niastensis]MDR7133534.1 hypothetical protein [Lysobacter niastensis]